MRAAEGWFPLLKGAGFNANEDGAPLYAPSRIGLLARLERDGWCKDELRLVASHEEWLIDNCLAGDEMPYLDDDLETLIRFFSDRIESFEHSAEATRRSGRKSLQEHAETSRSCSI